MIAAPRLSTELGILFAMVLAGSVPLPGCDLLQVTTSASNGGWLPVVSGDGRCVAFESANDYTGENPDGLSQVFLYGLPAGTLRQVTGAATGGSAPALGGDCDLVAYQRAVPTPDGAEVEQQVFLHRLSSGEAWQATQGWLVVGPTGLGRFATRLSYEGWASPDGVPGSQFTQDVFTLDLETGQSRRVSWGDGYWSHDSALAAEAETVVFTSDSDPLGTNPSHSLQVFRDRGAPWTLEQLTRGNSLFSFFPAIDGSGRRVAYLSNGDPLGTNPGHEFEIFLVDGPPSALRQMTFGGDSTQPALSGDGRWLAIASALDLTGGNSDLNGEIFRFDLQTDAVEQITDSTGGYLVWSGLPSLDQSGSTIAFVSKADLTGGNADQELEVFVARCAGSPRVPTEIPALAPLGLGLLSALLGAAGLVRLRRRG
jgi:Tol biopolymer transport system component